MRALKLFPALSLGAAVLFGPAAMAQSTTDAVAHGEYLATIMDCGGCHSRSSFVGPPDPETYLSGSTVGFLVPGLGVFYPPNLTPDKETGLGEWSDEEIAAAIREGVRPDGRRLAPAMPSANYGKMTDEDVHDLVAYLRSLPPKPFPDEPQPAKEGEATAPYLSVVFPAK